MNADIDMAEPSSTCVATVGRRPNAMTVDIEDYFQVEAFADRIAPADWDNYPCRVERNTMEVLELFSEAGAKATFFVLGWVVERYPRIVRRMAEQGHEIASHSMRHARVSSLHPDAFREDARLSKRLLEDVSGQPVRGYRAPTFSIDERSPWAHEILREEGYTYSSSIYPIRHDLYGMPSASRRPFSPCGSAGVVELPITTFEVGSRRYPGGGGGYFRLAPYALSRWAVRRVNEIDRQPAIFYFHPWEIDPDQPRLTDLKYKTRVRHYLNLKRTRPRLRRLLKEFAWDRMDRVFATHLGGR